MFKKSIPLVFASQMLALIGLANNLATPLFRPLLLTAAGIFGLLILWQCLSKSRESWLQIRQNSLVASAFASFFMGVQLISPSLPFPRLSWALAAFAYGLYLILFSWIYLSDWKKQLYPSWVVTYVGIATISISSAKVGQTGLGWLVFFLAMGNYLWLMPQLLRPSFLKKLPKPARPSLAILAAPTSLLLVAYLSLSQRPNLLVTLGLLALSQTIYLAVLWQFPKLIQPYQPGLSALTFPLVITAIALKTSLSKLGWHSDWLTTLSLIETCLAYLVTLAISARSLVWYFFEEQ